MSKQVSSKELANIVSNLLSGQSGEIDEASAFAGFMTAIAEVVCDYCGGEVRHSASQIDDPAQPKGLWLIGIHGNDSLPEDGGVWRAIDPDGSLFDEPENEG